MAAQDAPTRASRWVAVFVLVVGPILTLITQGPQVLGSFAFWFGLYGWLCAAIALGYVAFLIVHAASGRARQEA